MAILPLEYDLNQDNVGIFLCCVNVLSVLVLGIFFPQLVAALVLFSSLWFQSQPVLGLHIFTLSSHLMLSLNEEM